jgi:hypothetical protein
MTIKNYYYNQQLKKFIIGFANVFTGLTVKTGQGADGTITELEVPIRYGSADRVVAAIGGGNTQNKQHTLPIMACFMTGLNINPDRLHGVNAEDRRTILPQGGVFPDDVQTIYRVVPIPYDMTMDLSIHASNTDQMYQILEQILILFDYDMQLQFNDTPFDWTKISKLYLEGITNEEIYPTGVERRMIIWTLNFRLPIWLSPPLDVRKGLIQKIIIRMSRDSELRLFEMDATGELVPFLDGYDTTIIDPNNPEPGDQAVLPLDETDPTGLQEVLTDNDEDDPK